VSVFRPSARVQSPDGNEWEIYVYKLQVGDRAEWDTDVLDADIPYQPAAAELAVVNGVVWLVMLVPRMLARLFDVARAVVRSIGSDEWTVEAITFMPHQQSYVWRTTREFKGQVLAQVEGSLARGDPPTNLRNATYVGWRRSAR
jgi:hypothetical protein